MSCGRNRAVAIHSALFLQCNPSCLLTAPTFCLNTILLHCSPNSCGQVQVADIGIMGAPARVERDGKKVAVPGCNIFVGGKIGEESHLALTPYKKGIPLEEDILVPVLIDIAKEKFGAVDKKKKGLVKRVINKLRRK